MTPVKKKAVAKTEKPAELTREVVQAWANEHGLILTTVLPSPPQKVFKEVASYRLSEEKMNLNAGWTYASGTGYEAEPPDEPAAIIGRLIVQAQALIGLGLKPSINLHVKDATPYSRNEHRLVLGVWQ